MQWEYKMVSAYDSDAAADDSISVNAVLAEYSADGWELMHVIDQKSPKVALFFRRDLFFKPEHMPSRSEKESAVARVVDATVGTIDGDPSVGIAVAKYASSRATMDALRWSASDAVDAHKRSVEEATAAQIAMDEAISRSLNSAVHAAHEVRGIPEIDEKVWAGPYAYRPKT